MTRQKATDFALLRSGLLPCMLVLLLTATPYSAAAAAVKDYLPFAAELYAEGKRPVLISLRRFSRDHKEFYLAVDPNTMRTEVVSAGKYHILKKTFNEIRAKNKDLCYFRAITFAEKNSRPLQNAGITRLSGTNEVYLTADLCPSSRPLDRDFFRTLTHEFGKFHKPVPISISVSGRWMEKHSEDLKWLIGLEAQKKISITWINHSYTHFYRKGLPPEKNFLLSEGTNLSHEILQTEKDLIESGALPSVFFRFPGLVSNRELFSKMIDYGLIPVGSDAWLAKDQLPVEGSIILVHANGNEPEGIAKLYALIAEKEKEIASGRWAPGDLRTGVAKSLKIY